MTKSTTSQKKDNGDKKVGQRKVNYDRKYKRIIRKNL